MFGSQNYTSAWAWLPSAISIPFALHPLPRRRYGQLQCHAGTSVSTHARPSLTHHAAKALHKSLPPFTPYVSASLLPQIALVLLVSTFVLTFYFSMSVHPYSLPVFWGLMYRSHSLPKDSIPIREGAVASLASILGGFGVVALFCSVGVNV